MTLTEELADAIPLAEAARLMPGRPSLPTLTRYATNGCAGVRLRAWRVGRKWVTTRAAVEEFLQALNPGVPAATSEPHQ